MTYIFFLWFWPQLGSPQQKPKRLRLLVDVSGSMYRFNGVDGRLERSMEAVCMVMEALDSYEHKFKVRNWQPVIKPVPKMPASYAGIFLYIIDGCPQRNATCLCCILHS